MRLRSPILLLCLAVLVFVAAWLAWSSQFGPVEVVIVSESDHRLTVQIVEVSEVDRIPLADWRVHEVDPGQSVTESRHPSGDSILQLRVVRDDGRAQRYTVRHYLGSGHRLAFRLRLGKEGLAQARVRKGVFGESRDVQWDAE